VVLRIGFSKGTKEATRLTSMKGESEEKFSWLSHGTMRLTVLKVAWAVWPLKGIGYFLF
jgi:hypothetical protein